MTAASQPPHNMLVLDEIPLGCVAYRVDDNRCEPLIKRGDVIAVDTRDRKPMPEEPYLIEWSDGSRSVVAAYFTEAPAGSAWYGRLFVGDLHLRQGFSLAGTPIGKPIRWGEGPIRWSSSPRRWSAASSACCSINASPLRSISRPAR